MGVLLELSQVKAAEPAAARRMNLRRVRKSFMVFISFFEYGQFYTKRPVNLTSKILPPLSGT
jgi:hypothetical protein